jgi:hypothetical protein
MDKQDILNEIKRTAAQNGGVPLGSRRFRTETGISEYDWIRYWPRWGDAQREAGLTANKRQAPYSDETLIVKFIRLMRELNRFPTARDLRQKSRNESDFPSEKAYRRALGSKNQLASKVAAYCGAREDYQDVVKLCLIPNHIDSSAINPEPTGRARGDTCIF